MRTKVFLFLAAAICLWLGFGMFGGDNTDAAVSPIYDPPATEDVGSMGPTIITTPNTIPTIDLLPVGWCNDEKCGCASTSKTKKTRSEVVESERVSERRVVRAAAGPVRVVRAIFGHERRAARRAARR